MTVDRDPLEVLIVDSDGEVLRLLEIKLGRAGYHVVTAADEDAARGKTREQSIDIVVIGTCGTPESALAMAGELARLQPPPVIVFLSEREAPQDIVRALASGADDYVLKPFSPHELVHRLTVALARRDRVADSAGG